MSKNTKSTYYDRAAGASGKLGSRVPPEWGLRWLALIAGVSGCSTVKETTPPRTATDRAIEPARFPWLDGKFDSIAKVALFAYERTSGRYAESAGPMLGRAHLHLYKVLFVSWKRTDVPELHKHHKNKAAQADSPPPHR